MAHMNANFLNLQQNYLFVEIAKRVAAFLKDNPAAPLIKMGIGDVTEPLPEAAVEAGRKAFAEMAVKSTFRGYEDSGRGYEFLREAASRYYGSFGAEVSPGEVYVSDGAKSDCGNIGDIFSKDDVVLVTNPVYPVYVDANIMGGRNVLYASSDESNGFAAPPPNNVKADIIYLCSPNNPTGSAYTFEGLKAWVDFALKNNAVIIYDAAYEAFVTEADKPRSIMLIEGARECAVEICSFSKTAGFTGTRCGYTVIPKELTLTAPDGSKHPLHKLWERRQGSKFNGVSYPVQRAAEAVFSEAGLVQIREIIARYQANAKIIADTLTELGIPFTGGINSPYVWFKCPNGMESWEFFDFALNKINVVGTPGSGFGKNGSGRFRLTAFNTRGNTEEAMQRFRKLL